MFALGQDFTFSTDRCGLAGDVDHFLASVFLFLQTCPFLSWSLICLKISSLVSCLPDTNQPGFSRFHYETQHERVFTALAPFFWGFFFFALLLLVLQCCDLCCHFGLHAIVLRHTVGYLNAPPQHNQGGKTTPSLPQTTVHSFRRTFQWPSHCSSDGDERQDKQI